MSGNGTQKFGFRRCLKSECSNFDALLYVNNIFQPTQMVNTVAPAPGGIQIVQQIIGPNGEIQQIPIQLTNQQLQLIRAQMSGTN